VVAGRGENRGRERGVDETRGEDRTGSEQGGGGVVKIY